MKKSISVVAILMSLSNTLVSSVFADETQEEQDARVHPTTEFDLGFTGGGVFNESDRMGHTRLLGIDGQLRFTAPEENFVMRFEAGSTIAAVQNLNSASRAQFYRSINGRFMVAGDVSRNLSVGGDIGGGTNLNARDFRAGPTLMIRNNRESYSSVTADIVGFRGDASNPAVRDRFTETTERMSYAPGVRLTTHQVFHIDRDASVVFDANTNFCAIYNGGSHRAEDAGEVDTTTYTQDTTGERPDGDRVVTTNADHTVELDSTAATDPNDPNHHTETVTRTEVVRPGYRRGSAFGQCVDWALGVAMHFNHRGSYGPREGLDGLSLGLRVNGSHTVNPVTFTGLPSEGPSTDSRFHTNAVQVSASVGGIW